MNLQSDSEHELTDPFTSLCCLGFPLHLFAVQFLHGPNTSFCWCAGRAQRNVLFSPVCGGGFCRSRAVLADFLRLSHFLCFFTAVGHSRVLEDAMRYPLSASRTQIVLCWETEKAGLLKYVLLFRDQHPEESTLILVLSLRVDRHL